MKAHPLAELIGQSVSSNTSNDSKKFLDADKTEAEVLISTGTKVKDRMIEYKEKVLPNIDGFAIQTNGKIITEKNQIPSITISYGSYNIAHIFSLKLIQFTYENNNYVLLNDGNYQSYLIHEENWKTELYKNYPNVNNIKVFITLKYEGTNIIPELTELAQNNLSFSHSDGIGGQMQIIGTGLFCSFCMLHSSRTSFISGCWRFL